MFVTVTLLLLSVILLAVLYVVFSSYSRRNLPPFPARPVPVFGNLLSLGDNPREIFAKWRKKNGDVFSLYLGQTLFIVLNGYDVIKDALVTKGDFFSDRPPIFFDKVINSVNEGVIMSSGTNWQVQRTVSMSILKSLGMGKNILAENIMEEVGHYLDALSQFQGEAADIEPLTHMALCNVTCAMVEGKRRDYDDISFRRLIETMNYLFATMRSTNPLNFFPFLFYLPGDIFHGKEIARRMIELTTSFKQRYIEQKEYVQSEGGVPSCFIDAYFLEMSKSNKKREGSNLDTKNLVRLILDIFAAGTETSSTTILWSVLYLLHYPDVQKRIHQEIDSEIGTHRAPSMQDKFRLRFLNATIMEVQRIASVVPLSAMHLASDTVTFKGYTIPKGANIAPNLDSVLLDPQTWGEDVHTFRPQRHLDAQGKLVVRDEFIPFSIGRRICLGEGLAKMELFLFLASLLQKFSLKPEAPNTLPSLKEIYGFTSIPRRFMVKVVPRDN